MQTVAQKTYISMADVGFREGLFEVVPVGKIKIRRLASADFGAVKKIERLSQDDYRRYLRRTGEKDVVAPFIGSEYFNHYVGANSSFVAEVDGRVVGFILSKPIPFMHGEEKVVWLEQIMVLPEYLRKGVGSRLLSRVVNWAKRHKFNLLYATLNPNNIASRRLLEKHGFEVKDWKRASRSLP